MASKASKASQVSKASKASVGLPPLKINAATKSPHSHSHSHSRTPSPSPSVQSPAVSASASTPTCSSAWSPHSAPTPASFVNFCIHSFSPPPGSTATAFERCNPTSACQKSASRASSSASAAAAVAAAAAATPTAPTNKMSMASVISPMPGPPPAQPPISMTTKEWVIPPRPKPGRKPATDTPPTKRKAQNRAAQRAFRERRAARVGELEEQLEADQQEHEKIQQALQDQVRRLEMDAQALQSRCEVLENMLDKERAERSKEVEDLRNRLHEASQQQQQHRPQSLPSIASVPQHSHTYAPQPLRHHRPSAPSRLHAGMASASSGLFSSSRGVSPTTTTHRPATTHSFSISQIISPPEDIEQALAVCGNCEPTGPCACADEAIADANVGCGNCTLGSRCQCLEEVLNGGHEESSGSRPNSTNGSRQATSRAAKRTIRSISPSSTASEEKRPRGSLATETDFTAMFSRKHQRSTQPLPTPAGMNNAATLLSNAPTPYSMSRLAPMESRNVESPRPEAEDRCGFCEDGTFCACAEAAAFNAAAEPPSESLTLPAINSSAFSSASRANGQTRTPPPSEGDAIGYEILPDGSVKLPSLRGLQSRTKSSNLNTALPKPSGGCGPGGPGTCTQCINDPVSGLFCRSLAANFKKSGEPSSGGCCGGGGGAGGGCCKDKTSAENKPSSLGLSLSCADAYKTLASHKHFTEAADDINTWLPRLKAAPKPREPQLGSVGQDDSGRPPIEVEAASIMSVLKGFDVRFGRGD